MQASDYYQSWQIVYQDRVSNLKRKFLTRKLVEVRYAEEVEPDYRIAGVETLKTGRYGVKLQFDAQQTPVDSVMAALTQKGSVVDITISDPPLEEVIAKIYREAERQEAGLQEEARQEAQENADADT